MRVEVVRAWPRRYERVELVLAEDAVLGDALAAAGWAGDPAISGYAVFGVAADTGTPLREGDRVELLRPLLADPKDARRRRADARKG